MPLLRFAEFRVNRQGNCFPGSALSYGKVAFLVAQVIKTSLQVQRNGIIDARADAVPGQVFNKLIAVRGHTDNILMENVAHILAHEWSNYLEIQR